MVVVRTWSLEDLQQHNVLKKEHKDYTMGQSHWQINGQVYICMYSVYNNINMYIYIYIYIYI